MNWNLASSAASLALVSGLKKLTLGLKLFQGLSHIEFVNLEAIVCAFDQRWNQELKSQTDPFAQDPGRKKNGRNPLS